MSGVPSGWADDGTTLKAPNGVPVVHGIRAFVLANSWDAADVPLAPEESVNPVEVGNPKLGAGARQFFLRSGQVSWTPAMNVFRTWNGQEELALHAALADATDAAAVTQKLLAAANGNLSAAQQQRDALSAQLATAQAQNASDAQTIASLQAQLAALQSAPAPQQPTPPSPQEQAAVALAAAWKAFLAAS
jgi:hypothetical protein